MAEEKGEIVDAEWVREVPREDSADPVMKEKLRKLEEDVRKQGVRRTPITRSGGQPHSLEEEMKRLRKKLEGV